MTFTVLMLHCSDEIDLPLNNKYTKILARAIECMIFHVRAENNLQ